MNHWRILFISLSLVGCLQPPVFPIAEPHAKLGPDETILIGKISLSPPLSKSEQDLNHINGAIMLGSFESYRNNAYLCLVDEKPNMDNVTMDDCNQMGIRAPLEKFFFVRVPNHSFFVLQAGIMMEVGQAAMLPAFYHVDIKPRNKVVYMGTLKYFRDQFFKIQKAQLINETAAVYKIVQKWWGGYSFRAAPLQPRYSAKMKVIPLEVLW